MIAFRLGTEDVHCKGVEGIQAWGFVFEKLPTISLYAVHDTTSI
jgi:hypothetical protein